MSKKILILSLLLLLFTFPVSAKNRSGVNLPETLTAGDEKLVLNGAGLRKRFVVKVYAGALYLKQASSESEKIIAADEPMIIRLHFLYKNIKSEQMISAFNDGFKISTEGNIEPLQDRINAFNACFSENPKENDVYDLIYVPGKGVSVVANNQLKTTIQGLDFKQALFGIWLGEKTELKSLRKEMLGL